MQKPKARKFLLHEESRPRKNNMNVKLRVFEESKPVVGEAKGEGDGSDCDPRT
jgi:hypothetical protein